MEYKTAFGVESNGSLGIFAVKIEIDAQNAKNLSKEEGWEIQQKGEEILKILELSKVRQDPERIKWREEIGAELIGLFGDRKIRVEEIPNEYCPSPCCWHKPWFRVVTEIGTFKIGWRKRVINLDWTETDIEEHGEQLFPDESVTKSSSFDKEKYIHCWGLEDAQKYINTIFAKAKEITNASTV